MLGLLKYLSFQGRTNRKRYWLTALSIVGIAFVSALFAGLLSIVPALNLIVVPVLLALLIASIANGVRRLHDRNKSAWWLLLFYLLPAVLTFPAELASYSTSAGFQAVASLLALIGLPFSIWGLVVMGFLKGTSGPNRFGDDPLGQPVQEAFA